ncbi:MAG: stage III sporulation protein AG, partial [Firmicutes bacterium]|nr:stage III sporulation protein AG [Bacillota bacterium]
GASTTTTTVTKTPIIVGGNPIVVTETKPQIRGVVVVASGASDPGVRLAILRAVQTLVGDPGVRVEVLARTT